MKEKIIALLIASFSGVRKDALVHLARTIALQATTEDDAKTIVDKLTKAQVDEYVKEFRADVDKEVSESNKTYESNLKKKIDFVEKQNPKHGADDDQNKGGDIAAIVEAAIAKAVTPLQAKLDKYEQGDIAKTRLQMLNDKLVNCKDDAFKAKALKDYARMSVESDEAFNEYLTDTDTDIATANQNAANMLLGGQGNPFFAPKDESGISKGVADYVESQKPENDKFSGKEV